jgi:RNA polymerase sigma factor (TIGR02999 family)
LDRARAGEADALERLFPLVYDELRRTASRLLRGERPGHTLQPTALVHEAYLKLVGAPAPDWQNRAHFMGVAARAMRQLLIDHARRRQAAKRGGGAVPVRITNENLGIDVPLDELLALNDALDRLGTQHDRLRRVVELRFFAGLTEDEVAEALGVTARTAQRDWAKARAWLYKELYPERA